MAAREWQQRNVYPRPDDGGSQVAFGGEGATPDGRRAYYRVSGIVPIRITPLAPDEVDATIFDLSLPDPLIQPIGQDEDASPLAERLRRIEEKLDLLLGGARIDVPRQLSGRDRRRIVFSGSGLALDVHRSFRRGDAYKVEILLPPPHSRVVRAVAEAVRDASAAPREDGTWTLPLAIRHMEADEHDALVAYSYDLQRLDLRARGGRALSEVHS